MNEPAFFEILAAVKTYLIAPLAVALAYCLKTVQDLWKEFQGHKLEVARDYVHKTTLLELENKIDKKFDRIENKLDEIILFTKKKDY